MRTYAKPEKSTSAACIYDVASSSIMQNETGSRGEKWHKTDTRSSGSVHATDKKNAAPAGPRNDIYENGKDLISDIPNTTRHSNLEVESGASRSLSELLCELDYFVLKTLATPCGFKRNGWWCYERRSRIAREVGVERDILNASIRRLKQAGLVRSVYSSVLGRWGIELLPACNREVKEALV